MTNPEHLTLLLELIKSNTNSLKNRSNIATDIAKQFISKTKADINPLIIEELDLNYNKDGLTELAKHAQKMLKNNRAKIDAMNCNMPYELLNESGNIPKAQLVWSVAFIFCKPEIFLMFHECLPIGLQKAFQQLTWLPQAKGEVLGQLIGETVVTRSNHYYSSNELNKSVV